MRCPHKCWLTCAGIVAVLAGCRTAPPPIPGSQHARFESAFAADHEPVLTATESYAAADALYIRYRLDADTGYARAAWPASAAPAHGATDPPPRVADIASLEFYGQWSPETEAATAIAVLPADDWQRVRDRLLRAFVPDREGVGVLVRFPDDDYFLADGPDGRFKAWRLEDKPSDYRIASTVTMAELLQQGWRVLEASLAERRISQRAVLFNTGDTGPYSLPFVYANRDTGRGLFLRFVPRRSGPLAHRGSATGETIGHIGRSHLTGLLARPFTSLGRLFFMVFDAARDTVRPDWLIRLANEPIPPAGAAPPMDLVAWEAELDGLTGRKSSAATLRYLIDGEPFFDRFIETVANARKSIYVRTYIFDNDDVAARIADLLKRRSREGVEVKILLDGLATVFAAGEDPSFVPDYYQPPASMPRYLEQDSEVQVRLSPNPWFAGDHVKTFIIDNQIAFLGGMNIGREYRYEWHDMMVELEGPIVDRLIDDFHDNWAAAGPFGDIAHFLHKLHRHTRNTHERGYPVRILYTLPGDSEIYRAQLRAIRTAQRYIYIQHSYLTNDTMIYELAKARRRGVDVRVILPVESDIGFINRDIALVANAMLENGIRVFLYPNTSHIKAAVFDGWACLGSANLDNLSLRVNKELNIATSHAPAVNALLESLFEPDFARSVELLEPFPERWLDHLFEVLVDYL